MDWPSSGPRLHPAATLFPLMTREELVELRKDIVANGLKQPLLYTAVGELIDGRNRWLACRDTTIKLPQHSFSGNPYTHVIRQKLDQFQPNKAQRIMIGARLFDLPSSGPWIKPRHADVCTWLDIAESPFQRGRSILKYGIPELIELAEGGTVPITPLERVARLSPARQRDYVALVRRGEDPITVAPTAPDYHQGRQAPLVVHPPATPAAPKAPMPHVTLRQVASTLAAVGQQLQRCGDIDPSVSQEELVAWTKEMRGGLASLNKLRKRVQARLTDIEMEAK